MSIYTTSKKMTLSAVLAISSIAIGMANASDSDTDSPRGYDYYNSFTGESYSCHNPTADELVIVARVLSTLFDQLTQQDLQRNQKIDAVVEIGRALTGELRKNRVGNEVPELTDQIIKALNTFRSVGLIHHKVGMPLEMVGRISNLVSLTMAESDFKKAGDISALTGLKSLSTLNLNAAPVGGNQVLGSGEVYSNIDEYVEGYDQTLDPNLKILRDANPDLVVNSNDY